MHKQICSNPFPPAYLAIFNISCTYFMLQNIPFGYSTASETSSATSPVPVSCFASRHLVCDFMQDAFARWHRKVKWEKSSAKRLVKAVHLLLARRRVILHAFVYQPPLSSIFPASRTLSTRQGHPSSAHRDTRATAECCLILSWIIYKYIYIYILQIKEIGITSRVEF